MEFNTVIETHTKTIVFCNNIAEEQRFQEIIHDLRIESNKQLELRIGHLSKGFQFSDIQIAILAHHEIFHRYKQRREVKKPIQTRAIDSFLDLKKGDYVVHISHGIGRFLGMETLEEEGYKKRIPDNRIQRGNEDIRPATKIEVVQKYIGSSDHRPRLDKIGSKYWEIRKNGQKTPLSILPAICCTCRHCGMRKKVLSIRMTLIGSESSKRNLFTKRLLTKFK